ncbi:MAG: VOC family protein [Pseudomonadota bacterium]
MTLKSLGYIGVRSARTEDWSSFATDLLGMQQIDRGGHARAFRMDDRKQRLLVTGDGDEGLDFMGWEVDGPSDLDDLASRLDNAGVAVAAGPAALADQRLVGGLISFQDPDGNHIEVFHGPQIADDPFRPGRPIQGFKTGSLGMGHAVLHVANIDALVPFYCDLLGFSLTDYGKTPYKLYFFHLNGRHHSFAMVGSGQRGLHHFMVELETLDDVGQGYDLAQQQTDRVAYTLGRHTNDHMLGFYANSPSGFFVEYGWGARVIEPDTWEPVETFDGPSFWGHDRLHLPEDSGVRAKLKSLTLDTSKRGLKAPDPDPNCIWLDNVTRNSG